MFAMDEYHDNLIEFARSYVGAAGSTMGEVSIEKSSSPLALVDLVGATCIQTERAEVGYDIAEYDKEGEKFLLILDRMSGYWVFVQ